MPELSIIIPTFNSLAYLPACLASIGKSDLSETTCEVIVIDNGSSDGTRAFLAESSVPFPLLWQGNEANTGFSAACNQGASLATGKVFLFLNPDVELYPDCLRRCLQYLGERQSAGVLGCRLRFPDGSYQKSAGSMRSFVNEIRERRIQKRLRAGDWKADPLALCDQPCLVDWVAGAALFVRAELFRKLDGFDTGFFAYFEDIDFCVRSAKTGNEVIYHPLAGAVHVLGASAAQIPDIRAIYRASQLRFYRKHHGGLNLLALRLYLVFLSFADWSRQNLRKSDEESP